MSLTGYIVGTKGNTGRGISGITENNDYTITINYTDGTSFTTEPIPGYTNVAFDTDYNLVVTKTDGTTETIPTQLKSYMTTASGYKTDAETAATNAGNSATAADGSANTATAQATLARSYAKGDTSSRTGEATDNADYYRQQASTSATSASTSAGTATTQALKSEGYAVGEQNGSAVASDSPYYNNNASYYYDMAKNKAVESNQAKRDSVSASQKSEAYAKGTINGVDVESGSTGYHDNSKYYKEQASTSATSASSSASTATTNALKSEGYAVGKQNGTDVSSGTYYENNAKYYATEAENSASAAASHTAPTYDATKTYKVGEYVVYSSQLYKCTTAITTAEAWTVGHWTQVALGDDVADLKDDFNKIISPIYNKSLFEMGGMSSGDGSTFEATNRIRSINTFTKDEIIGVVAENGYLVLPYAWSNGSYVGVLQNDGTFDTGGAPTYVNAYTFVYDYDYKVVIKKADNANMDIDDAEKLLLKTLTDATLSFPLKSADAKVVGDRLREVENKTQSLLDTTLEGVTIGELIQYKITDLSLFTYGFAINGSGVLGEYADCYATKDFIYVASGARVRALLELTASADHYQWIACYNSSKTFIGRIGGEYVDEIDEALLEGTKYIRISLTYVGQNNVSSYNADIYYPVKSDIGSPKNKWYILGDSISAGYYSMLTADVPSGQTPSVTYEDGTCSLWDSSLEHNYWGYINKWFLKRELVGKAYPAQGYIHLDSKSNNGVKVVKNTDFSDAGLITVAWGLNDWHYEMTRGDHNLIDANEPIATAETDTTNITTINQAIWYCLGVLIDKAPQAKILVQTPMNAWRYGGDFASKWGINTSLSQSGTLKDIHDDIIYWCDYYGLEYIDLTFNNSVVNLVNIKEAIIDGSHPSDETHQQLARSIWAKVGY